jgi:NDP-sugar pyrophosphorylase family protein
MEKKRTVAYLTHERWLDIGLPEELQRASELNPSILLRSEK